MYFRGCIMVAKKGLAVLTAGLGVGTAQTFILREYVDKTYGVIPGLGMLKGFGTYSALGGIISGGVATGLGLVSVLTGKITRNETIQLGLIGYGIPALSGGILSGLFPAIPIAGLRAPARGGVNLRYAGVQGQGQGGRVVTGQAVGQTGAIPLRS